MYFFLLVFLSSFSSVFSVEQLDFKQLHLEEKGTCFKFNYACFDNQQVIEEYAQGVSLFAQVAAGLPDKGGTIGAIYRAEVERVKEQQKLTEEQKQAVVAVFNAADKVKQKEKMDRKNLLRYYYRSYLNVLERHGIDYPKSPVEFLEVNSDMDYTLKNQLLAGSFLLYATQTFEITN